MQKKINRVLRWVLLIAWLIFIFIMSNTPGDLSTEQSNVVVRLIGKMGVDISGEFKNTISFCVRKAAHISEYIILFILVYRVIVLYIKKEKARLYALIIIFLYASSDEFHQYFVPGREAAFRDVLIDTSGGLIAMLFTLVVDKVKKKK
ncbi:VanZ family protein [Clostridium sp. MSJ-8]|uniref:VanZ family protein n=1 Tax=Clostridium sp. MSJ-8 TaxID=2841510 RepID=UPI001C0F189A|nr:VanZ family protein [Clostridium sp. MSJ-8]